MSSIHLLYGLLGQVINRRTSSCCCCVRRVAIIVHCYVGQMMDAYDMRDVRCLSCCRMDTLLQVKSFGS
ncbi:unnamed protein product [Lathyrus oleraceus]